MNLNKTITEAMGQKWHEAGNDDGFGIIECSCGGWWPEHENLNKNYSDPIHYCALMDWMRGPGRSLALQEYCDENVLTEPTDIDEWLGCDRQEQINLIAEAAEAGALK